MIHVRMPHVLGALLAVALGGLAAVAAGGASAESAAKRGTDTITISRLESGRFKFDGPSTVPSTSTLRVVNDTDPSEVGPHTFSLVKKESLLPQGEGERGKCGRFKIQPCKRISEAHGFTDPRPPTYTTKPVESGAPGWDKAFTGKKDGDSYLFDVASEQHQRVVTAAAGTTFYALCLIYPRMQKKIEVVQD